MSLMDMKLGVITHDTLERLKQCNNKIKNDLSAFKNFLFCDDSQKNKNLLNINMDKELKRETFKDFIFDKINKDGNLEDLLLKKRENEEALLLNKYKIKKDEKYLLDTFYCLKCKTRARNAISKSCNHLVLCEECIQSTKVCPRCGMNVSNYDKIFRS